MLKCYVKPMKDPLGVSPSKGNQVHLFLAGAYYLVFAVFITVFVVVISWKTILNLALL